MSNTATKIDVHEFLQGRKRTIVIDVMSMVESYLKEHGYDGLLQEDGECACLLGDLAPCGEMQASCRAGHRVECDPNADEDDRPNGCDGKCGFHVMQGKRQEASK